MENTESNKRCTQDEMWNTPRKTSLLQSNDTNVIQTTNIYEILSESDDDVPDIITVESISEQELNDADDRFNGDNIECKVSINNTSTVTTNDTYQECKNKKNKIYLYHEQIKLTVENWQKQRTSVNRHERDQCTRCWSYLARLTQSYLYVEEAI